MADLKKEDGTLLSDKVYDVLPEYRTQKTVKQLLSGAFHVQTVGVGAKVVSMTLFADWETKEYINLAESQGTTLRLENGAVYMEGVVESQPVWRQYFRELYLATLKMLVSEEGTI